MGGFPDKFNNLHKNHDSGSDVFRYPYERDVSVTRNPALEYSSPEHSAQTL